MASPSLLSLLSICFLAIVSNLSSSYSERENQVKRRVAAEASEVWCVAKNNAEDGALQSALDWVCGLGGADCGPIQQGGACYDPSDIQAHASYAFNDYFHKNIQDPQACVFGNAAALTALNPSHGKCVFPSSFLARNGNFTGLASGTKGIMGPSAADLSGSNSACRWDLSFVAALMMVSTALIL